MVEAEIFLKGQFWIVEITLAMGILILINLTFKRFLKFVRCKFLSAAKDWRDKIDHIFYLPVLLMVWVIGLGFILDLLAQKFGYSAGLEYLKIFRNISLVVCVSWVLLRWKKEIQKIVSAKQGPKHLDPSMILILSRLATMGIVVVSVLVVLQIVGLNTTPLLAFGGLGAAGMAIASKDAISNFLGGFMLYITRPFTVGDLISLPDRRIEGTVEEIGWYLTSIRDRDKRPLYLPNAIFSNQVVINCSRMSHRKIEERIGISYEDFPKIQKIVSSIKAVISGNPSIDKHLPVIVVFNHFNQYSLDIYIEVYTLTTRYEGFLAVKQEILFDIQKVISDAGAKMPFPTTTVDLPECTSPATHAPRSDAFLSPTTR